ncbi:transducin beta-like protein 3 [Metopolophium dirhodum]|uniref:transducin beta-like protein 3 n=1 Tax=Metopolophium dirhodum TaxID=44670 RepID=UPI00298FAC43|nr:transducin beta-like protein 3 [Metopolophium dirhodum]
MSIKLREIFKPEYVQKEFYTGGHIEWTPDGHNLLCQCGPRVSILDIETTTLVDTIPQRTGSVKTGDEEDEEDECTDSVITFTLDPTSKNLITSHKSGLLCTWDWNERKLTKSWRHLHKGPVMKLAITSDQIIASGGTDSIIRLWKSEKAHCLYALHGAQGNISALKFLQQPNSEFWLFAADMQCEIHVWSCDDGKHLFKLQGHFSTVTEIAFYKKQYLISCGRDKVVILWDLESRLQLKMVALYDCLETMVVLPEEGFYLQDLDNELKNTHVIPNGVCVAVGGENGGLHIWDVKNNVPIFKESNADSQSIKSTKSITNMIFNETRSTLAICYVDNTITLQSFGPQHSKLTLIGSNDEILDVALLGNECSRSLAVAINSCDIYIFPWHKKKVESDDNCEIDKVELGVCCKRLKGHTDTVLCLVSYKNFLISSSKDHCIRVWLYCNVNRTAKCVAIGSRHTGAVNTVAISKSLEFIVSASTDTTLKLWKLPKTFKSDEPHILSVKLTEVGHEKEINSICIAPNYQTIATGSQDKLIKIWSANDLSVLGVCRGHKRGVWCVRFSPIDQVLLSSSADTTLKIWSMADYSCLKTLESHDSSVLKGGFLNHGTQVASCGGDGLVKIWCLKTSECIATLDKHSSKVWALSIVDDGSIMVTGGTDSRLVVWHDRTEEVRISEAAASQTKALQDQQLQNLLQNEQLLPALKMSITLERPNTALKIIQTLSKQGQGQDLYMVFQNINQEQKERLLNYVVDWNNNGKYCLAAQLVLNILLEDIMMGKLTINQEKLQGLMAYSERHYRRLTTLMTNLQLLRYTTNCMAPHLSNE